VPEPAALQGALTAARGEGLLPGVLVLTLPDNPTGTVASEETVRAVAAIAGEEGLLVVCDEIYRDLTHEPERFCSPATLVPDRVFVTTGLSKSMALGGWRVGLARLPDGSAGEEAGLALAGLASEIWSSLAAPMQHAAEYVLSEPPEVLEHVAASRRLHRAVITAAHRVVVDAGATCRPPSGAFYLYPDFEPLRDALEVRTGAELCDRLLEEQEIAVLAGEAFGDDPGALRFRMATSLLYGQDDEQRRTALESDDPVSLPWIGEALERLADGLARLP